MPSQPPRAVKPPWAPRAPNAIPQDDGKASHLPSLWARLPTEIKERVLSFCGGTDENKDVRSISQVNDDWLEHVRWAQPRAFARQQQQMMLRIVAEGGVGPMGARAEHHLRHCHQLSFDLVQKKVGLENALCNASGAALKALTEVLPAVDTVNLVGLHEGPALFARWAQHSTVMASVQSVGIDRVLTTSHGLFQLCQVADKAPRLTQLVEQGSCVQTSRSLWLLKKLPENNPVLDLTSWRELAHIDLKDCGLWLGSMVLRGNSKLSYLNVSGNRGVDTLLVEGKGPGASLQELVFSTIYLDDYIFSKLHRAAWTKNLLKLTVVGRGGRIAEINLADFPALRHLDLEDQDLNYVGFTMPPGQLETLNLSKTWMTQDNAMPAGSLAQGKLWRLILGSNHLTGMLNRLDIFAAANLRVLDLSRCTLGQEDIATWYVPEGNSLTHLELSENQFSGSVLALLRQKPLKQLRYLGMRLADEAKARSLCVALLRQGSLRQYWPGLQMLSLWMHKVSNPKIHGDVLDLLEREGVALGQVRLSEVPNDGF